MKNNKGKIFLWIFIEVILATTFISICWSPLKNVYCYPNADDVIATLSNDNIAYTNSCEIDGKGQVNITGPDAYIVYNNMSYKARTIAINFENQVEQNIPIQLFVDYGNGFSELDSYQTTCFAGEKIACFEIQKNSFSAIRIDIDYDYELCNVQLHKNLPIYAYFEQNNKILRISIGVVFSFLALFMLLYIDKKYFLSNQILAYIQNKRRKILIIILVGALVVILQKVLPINGFTYVMVIGICAIVVCFVYEWKRINEKPECLFVKILLIIGSLMILEQPFGHTCWDLDSHYKWVLESTSFGDAVVSDSDMAIMYNQQEFVASIENGEQNQEKISWINAKGKYANGYFSWQFSLPHMLNGIAIAILRLLGFSFYWTYTLAKFPSLFIYALACYFGIKKLKSGKMIFATIALFPTNIFIACNYTYDYWVTGFSLLGMAYFIGICQEKEKKVEMKECIIMCGAFILSCIPKPIYFTFLILPFLMPKNKIDNKKKYYRVCVLAFVTLFLFLFIKSILITTGTGDLRGGAVNPSAQIQYIINNILVYAGILFEFMKSYLSVETMDQYISHFAYLGIGSYSIVFKLVLLITMITDKNQYDKKAYPVISRLFVIVMFFSVTALIATALYISFTPVGTNGIGGCQPRYIIPLIYPLCSILFGSGTFFITEKIGLELNGKIYKYIIFFTLTSILYFDIYRLMYMIVR